MFVVPFFDTKRVPDKFTPTENLKISLNSWEQRGRFVFRHDAEYNAILQQIIPYILVTDAKGQKVYVTERIAGEERLKGSLTLGCGGHINPCDADGNNIILNAAIREMNEELNIKQKDDRLHHIGYVRDLSSTTSDHMGIVIAIKADSVSVRETDNLAGRWMTLNELIAEYGRFESWARHIIDYLYTSHSFNKIFI